VRELSVCSTAIGTDKGPEICAYILWSQIVAVDAPLVGGQLEQPAYDPLVLLVLLHRLAIAGHLSAAKNPAGPSSVRACVRASARSRTRAREGAGRLAVATNRKGSPAFVVAAELLRWAC